MQYSLQAYTRHNVLNGNCFFYCISQSIYGEITHHLRIRSRASQYLLDHVQDFFPFFSGLLSTYTQHCSLSGKPGIWADALIIRATAIVCNRAFTILTLNNYIVDNIASYHALLSTSIITMVNINNRHFDLLTPSTSQPIPLVSTTNISSGPATPNSHSDGDEDDDINQSLIAQQSTNTNTRRHQTSQSTHKWRKIPTYDIQHTDSSNKIPKSQKVHAILPNSNQYKIATNTTQKFQYRRIHIKDETNVIADNLIISSINKYRCPYNECTRSMTDFLNSRKQLKLHVQTHIEYHNFTCIPNALKDLNFCLCRCGKIRSTIRSHIFVHTFHTNKRIT